MDGCCGVQALSKRVHYGKFVAEAKFLAQTAEYTELIRKQDGAGIMELLTNKAVEKQVCDPHCCVFCDRMMDSQGINHAVVCNGWLSEYCLHNRCNEKVHGISCLHSLIIRRRVWHDTPFLLAVDCMPLLGSVQRLA